MVCGDCCGDRRMSRIISKRREEGRKGREGKEWNRCTQRHASGSSQLTCYTPVQWEQQWQPFNPDTEVSCSSAPSVIKTCLHALTHHES